MIFYNDVHILYYVLFGMIGLIAGEFSNWMNNRLPEYKSVFTKNFIKEHRKSIKPNYILMIIEALIFIGLLYKFGLADTIVGNLTLIKYCILTPMLISALMIDYKLQIIPNRLNLSMFEIGLIFTFLYGMSNINLALNSIYGMLAGAGIFLIITLLGGFIAGKEAMGFGDVKLMGALGLYFGLSGIIVVSLIAFLVGAIISIVLIVTKIKKTSEYIPFGPFIVIACFMVMFIPFNVILNVLLKVFTLGMY